MKIYYRKDSPGFYFMTTKENGLWLFSAEIPDINTLQLCECYLSPGEKDKAFEEAVEVPYDLMVKFNSVYDKKGNYTDVCEILKTVFDVSQEELDKIYEHDPEMIEKTREVVDFCVDGNLNNFFFRKAYWRVRHLLSLWDDDLDRVKNYMKEHGDLDYFHRDDTIVDVWCDDERRYSLLRDFHKYWGNDLDKLIDEAIERHPDYNDFDKRYYYVKEKLKNL